MLNEVARLPHLFNLEFISADNPRPDSVTGHRRKGPYIYRITVITRKAIREFLPHRGVHPHIVTSAGLDYKLGPIEEAGKTCLRYNPCGSESENMTYVTQY
jgi:hypothetical protein